MTNKIYSYEIKYDFINAEKTKTVSEGEILAETKTRIVCLEGRYKFSEYITIFNKTKEDKSSIYQDLNKADTSNFKIGDYKDEVSCRIHLTEKPKSEKVIFNKLTKELNKFIQKKYSKYNIGSLDFSDVETERGENNE